MNRLKISFLLFFIILIAYVSITGGNVWEYDSHSVLEVAKNIVDKKTIAISCFFGEKASSGACYSRYGVLMSLVIIPFYLLDKFFQISFFVYLTNCAVTALLSVLIFNFLQRLNFSTKMSLLGSLIFSFATFAPFHTKTLFSEPLLTLLAYSSLYFLLFNKRFLLSGILMFAATLTKASVFIGFIPLLLYSLITKAKLKKNMTIILFAAISIIAYGAYNYFRFGNIFETGYANISFKPALLGSAFFYIFSPGASIFLFQPVLFLAFFGLRIFQKKSTKVFIVLLLFVVLYLIVVITYSRSREDWSWGPRLLYPILPFMVISLMFFAKEIKTKILKFTFYILVVISILIQLSSVVISYHRFFSFTTHKYGEAGYKRVYENYSSSPIFGQFKMIFKIDYKKSEKNIWREAFSDREKFDIKNTIGPFDLFFLWSKKNILILFVLLIAEGLLMRKMLSLIKPSE
jgi:hypothetical protein